MDKGDEVQLRVATFHTRGLRGSLNRVLKLAREMDITGITETCVRQLDTGTMRHMCESVNTIPERDRQKGYEGYDVFVSPMIPFKVKSKLRRARFQSIIIKK